MQDMVSKMPRIWTEQEKQYLIKRYPYQSAETTAKKLNRSVVSVMRKAKELGVSIYFENIHATTVAKAFNTDIGAVKKWIEKYGLPCRKIQGDGFNRYIIEPDKFWKWSYEHRNTINWGKYTPKSILPEPEWLDDEIKAYKTPNTRNRFSEEEKVIIRKMIIKDKMPYKEIALKTGRTLNSIKNFARRY